MCKLFQALCKCMCHISSNTQLKLVIQLLNFSRRAFHNNTENLSKRLIKLIRNVVIYCM